MTGFEPDRAAADEAFLGSVGERLRLLRARRGVTRRDLARLSRVSERYIAQLEAGSGNVSILLLRRIARALGVGAEELVAERPEQTPERMLLAQVVAQLPEAEVAAARRVLLDRLGRAEAGSRGRRVALIGLRGAGKSTLGKLLAGHLGVGFVELDREVEREGRMELTDIFALHGPEGFRRLEREALQRLVREGTPAVIAAGGGIVAEPATFEFLLDTCVTIWLRAAPEEHMRRVVEQGDLRPMRDNRRAMDDLRAILTSREGLYAKADFAVDTSGQNPAATLAALLTLPGIGEEVPAARGPTAA